MTFRLLSLALILSCFLGCAPQRQALKPSPFPAAVQPTPMETPIPQPVLTDEQLLGLVRPPGMIRDPESGNYALPQVMESFSRMRDKAAQDGWHLVLVSGYRSFKHQMRIWNHYDALYQKTDALDAKRRVKAVMSLVSVPGLSRHHWGTDLDISEAGLRGQLVNVDPDTPARVVQFYNWMEHNAPQYGFCKVYLGKRGAIRDEPWHWSYFPYSQTYFQQFMSIRDFHRLMDARVDDVHYLMRNFPRIVQQETRSINTECSLEIQN